MIAFFRPKFYKGRVRSIYYERLLKKAARVGADVDLIRRLVTLLFFNRCEELVGVRELECDVSVLPAELRSASVSDAEKVFLAFCYEADADLDWGMYYLNADDVVASLVDELELNE